MEEKLRDIESALTYENDPEKRAAVWAMLMSFASYQDLGMFYQTHKVIEHAMIYLAADLQHEDDRVVWSAECALAVIASNPNLTELASVRDGIKNAIPLLENNTRRQLGHYNVPLSAHLALQSISRNPKLSSVDTASAAGQAQATGTFVAVVIDADSNDRAQLTKRIEDSGQFDEVLSAESEEAAQRLITAKQDVLYDTETRFIKIQVTGKTLTLSTNGFEPKILDPHLDINDAIKAYLQDV